MGIPAYDRHNPFISKIKERYVLNKPGASRETWHFVLDLKGSHIQYEPGDSIGIIPQNDPIKIEKILSYFGKRDDEEVEDSKGRKTSFSEFITYKTNLAHAPKKLLIELVNYQSDVEKKEKLIKLLEKENESALKEYLASFDLEELLAEYDVTSLPCQLFVKLIQPLLPRLYSIASSPHLCRDEVHLTVARVRYHIHGKERRGVCSHFLCDVTKENEPNVAVYLQPTKDFRLPKNDDVPIIMIGPGTGVAPFRSFMQERYFRKAPVGKSWLFFGERNGKTDYFYEEFWDELVSLGLLQIDTAFSRDQGHKVYVQDRLWEKRAELFRWLQEGSIVYVCGDASKMAKDVDHMLHKIIEHEGKLNQEGAREYMKNLRFEKRYIRDVY
jgi:sulfite reductase (NADPH) flavoprotein alpha-component